jgi:hypothetical protein
MKVTKYWITNIRFLGLGVLSMGLASGLCHDFLGRLQRKEGFNLTLATLVPGIGYFGAACLLNRTRIIADETGVTVKRGPVPLPWSTSFRVEADRIKRWEVRTSRSGPYGPVDVTYGIVLLTKDGSEMDVISSWSNLEKVENLWRMLGALLPPGA